MYDQVIAWTGLALATLLVLSLVLPTVQKIFLELCAWSLRLALLGLLGAAAYLWFRPDQLPVEVTDSLNHFPGLRAMLPEPGSPFFGISLIVPFVALLLPLLAVLDVTRKLAGRHLRRLQALTAPQVIKEPNPTLAVTQPLPNPATLRPLSRREAAEAMLEASARRTHQVSEPAR